MSIFLSKFSNIYSFIEWDPCKFYHVCFETCFQKETPKYVLFNKSECLKESYKVSFSNTPRKLILIVKNLKNAYVKIWGWICNFHFFSQISKFNLSLTYAFFIRQLVKRLYLLWINCLKIMWIYMVVELNGSKYIPKERLIHKNRSGLGQHSLKRIKIYIKKIQI